MEHTQESLTKAEKGSLCNSRRKLKAPTTVGCLALLPPIMPQYCSDHINFNENRMSTALNIKSSQLSPSPGKLVKQVDLNCSTFASQYTVPVMQRPDSFDEMIQCDKCDTWYHFKCAKVKEDPLEDWFCSSCRQLK